MIARLDQLKSDDDLKAKLGRSEWDLIACDEAHKMSASYFGGEIKETKRYKLGKLLGTVCRHYLLLTATPHNGRDEDFQLFMALLDGDRFEGKPRQGTHTEVARHDAPTVQGGDEDLRRQAALPGAYRHLGQLQALRWRNPSLPGGDRLRQRRNEPCRAAEP